MGNQDRVNTVEVVYKSTKDLITMLPKDIMTKLLIWQAIRTLNGVSTTLE